MASVAIAEIVIVADEAKYEVRIEIIYNEATARQVLDIIQEALYRHKGACKVDIKIRKIDDDAYIPMLTIDKDRGYLWYHLDGSSTELLK